MSASNPRPAPKPRHEKRGAVGRYVTSKPCDACGLPVGTEYLTDDEVCGLTDDPGFYLCQRKTCATKRAGLDVEARRALYTERRKLNAERDA